MEAFRAVFAGFSCLRCGSPCVLVSFCPCLAPPPPPTPILLPPPPICTHSIARSHTFPPPFCVSVLLQNHLKHSKILTPQNLLSAFMYVCVCVCRLGECVSPRAAVASHSKQMLRVKLRNASLARRRDRRGALQDGCDCLRRCLTLSVSLLPLCSNTFSVLLSPAFGILAVTSALASQAATPGMFSGWCPCGLRVGGGEHRCM